MPENKNTDLAIIGAGPGGYAAAFLAADKGMVVTLIDTRSLPGGACLHVGCIPSKALLHAAKLITDSADAKHWGIEFDLKNIDVNKLRSKKKEIVESLAGHLADRAKRSGVKYVQARAQFKDSTTLSLTDNSQITFKHCIIATGSSPLRLPQFDIDGVFDSTAALELESVPKSLLVIGGGYIGLEMGTVYAALGSKVTVVELMKNLLPGVDKDLVRPLYGRLKNLFENIYLETKVTKLENQRKKFKATLEGEEVEQNEMTFDQVLVSVGRSPNSKELGLENTSVETDDNGFIRVNEHRRTSDSNIFAIGDVAGEPQLAHKAAHEGKVAVQVIAGEPASWDVRAIPAVVFTDPEIAWCGLTETDAKQNKQKVNVARFPWAASGRATTLGRADGVTKVIVDPETDQVLGIGICGVGAGEMIAEGVVAIEMGATARDLTMCIHPHPTMTETIMEAAESLHGLATHLYRPKK